MPKSRIVEEWRRDSRAGKCLRAALHPIDDRDHAGDLQAEVLDPLDHLNDDPPVVTTSSTITTRLAGSTGPSMY